MVMRLPPGPEEFEEDLKKKNRIQRLEPKIHKIERVEGRGLKELWRKIIEKAQKSKKK